MIWTNFIVPIAVGVISGILATVLYTWNARRRAESSLRKRFAFLEGRWEHVHRDGSVFPNAYTTITYDGSAVFTLGSTTPYGDWTGRLAMNPEMPNLGSGVFQYPDKDESGSLQIVVKGPSLIHVAPDTITHATQKTDFYMWRKLEGSA
jgi:hypothetical protein